MSGFSDLAGGGADCGPGNGMNGLMKQLNRDHSLEQATQASTSKQAFRQAFRQNAPAASPGVMSANSGAQGPGTFNFTEMRHELGGMQARPMVSGADWSADFARHQVAGPATGNADLERAFMQAGARPGPIHAGAPMHMRPMVGPHAGWAEQFHQPAVQASVSTAASAAAVQANPMAMAFNEAR
ncbi:hypothetical protein IW136_006429, partial [Coemansia sp. RSA 678]